MTDDPYTYTVKLKRGSGSDVQKCKVTAPDIETLQTRVDAVRDQLREWADDYRSIQPDERRLPDDQSELSEVSA